MIFPVVKICYLMWCEEPFTLGMVSRLPRALYPDLGQVSLANGDTSTDCCQRVMDTTLSSSAQESILFYF